MKEIIDSIRRSVLPDPTLDLVQWANKFFLTPQGSAVPGLIDTKQTPYLEEILKSMSWSSPHRHISFIKGTQVGATTILDIVLQATVDNSPCPVLVLFGSEVMAKDHVSTRIEPAFETNPKLKGKVKDSYDRSGKNNKLLKVFEGGSIKFAGGVSGKAYRSYSAAIVMIDDVDALGLDIGGTSKKTGEGSPLKLAKSRTDARQGKYKLYFSGTPTDKDTSLIYKDFIKTDQRRFFVPCPDCSHFQVIDFFRLRYKQTDENELVGGVSLECEVCGSVIPEEKKNAMLLKGEWRATSKSSETDAVGYWLPSTYSNLGYTWRDMVTEYLDAQKRERVGDFSDMIHFYNTRLGLPWEQKKEGRLPTRALQRRKKLLFDGQEWLLPSEIICVFAGVDIQANRLECSVVGYGKNNERWILEHKIIGGDPWVNYDGDPSGCWCQLETFLNKNYKNEFGYYQPILAAGIDAGYCSENVSFFVVKMRTKQSYLHFFPIKGDVTQKNFINRSRVNNFGVDEYNINVNIGKFQTFNQLKIMKEGAGYIHFSNHPSLSDNFFNGLTIETFEYKNGKPSFSKPKSSYNEPTDTVNYSLAVEQIFNPDYDSFLDWNRNGSTFLDGSKKEKRKILSDGI